MNCCVFNRVIKLYAKGTRGIITKNLYHEMQTVRIIFNTVWHYNNKIICINTKHSTKYCDDGCSECGEDLAVIFKLRFYKHVSRGSSGTLGIDYRALCGPCNLILRRDYD